MPTEGGPGAGTTGRRRLATIQDVADDAGVSKAAVSKVIRGAYGVSPQMQTRVEEAIQRLDYRPRVAARVMRGASFTLGIEIPQLPNEFLTMIAQGAVEALSATRYQLVIAPIAKPIDSRHAIENLVDRQVDGVITVAPRVSQEWLERLSAHTPVVMVGRHDVSAHYDTVAGADAVGAGLVMDHLFALGHERITHLTRASNPVGAGAPATAWDPSGAEPHAIRERVFRERMADAGLEPCVVDTDGEEEDAHDHTVDLLASRRPPTAIFAGNDLLAIGAMRAIAEAGLGPEDVSVVGYDDITIASHPLVSLTSVDQSGSHIGQEAVRLLLERIAGRTEAVQLETDVALQVRRSTTVPRR